MEMRYELCGVAEREGVVLCIGRGLGHGEGYNRERGHQTNLGIEGEKSHSCRTRLSQKLIFNDSISGHSTIIIMEKFEI